MISIKQAIMIDVGNNQRYALDVVDEELLRSAWTAGFKVPAIKWLRERSGFGLKEAKDTLEMLAYNRAWPATMQAVSASEFQAFTAWKEKVEQESRLPTSKLGELLKKKLGTCRNCGYESDQYRGSGVCPECGYDNQADEFTERDEE